MRVEPPPGNARGTGLHAVAVATIDDIATSATTPRRTSIRPHRPRPRHPPPGYGSRSTRAAVIRAGPEGGEGGKVVARQRHRDRRADIGDEGLRGGPLVRGAQIQQAHEGFDDPRLDGRRRSMAAAPAA